MIDRVLIWLSLQLTLVNGDDGDVTQDQLSLACKDEDQVCKKNWIITQRQQCDEAAIAAIPKDVYDLFADRRKEYLLEWVSPDQIDKDFTQPGQEAQLSNEQCCNLVNSFCKKCKDMGIDGKHPDQPAQ